MKLYNGKTEATREGPRLLEEREAKVKSLRETVEASLAEVGLLTNEEVEAELNAHFERRKGSDRLRLMTCARRNPKGLRKK